MKKDLGERPWRKTLEKRVTFEKVTLLSKVFISSSSFKQRSREIAFGGVGEDGNDRFAFAELFCEAHCGGDVGTAADAAHDAFLGCEILGCL